ncbi:hypothetical protein RHMOL_Rhmol02G0237900 [Rhododendron molle]|uniref:Uncharacterized protein n=1 Tax=Rhododendron molle TaxID=49168 RepID=A0ACC0PVW2_RHOML|nr:hypothetical protein RHMOL_Rhmol02G0237900 [Rhododendron molle]
MDAVRRLIKGDKNNGDNATRLINYTDEVMEIREFRGIFTDENNFISVTTVIARKHTNIDATKYGGDDSQGGHPSYLMIFGGGSLLRSSKGDLLLPGEEFIRFKTVTIDQVPEDQNSTGVVNYEVKFQQRDASVTALKAMTLDPSKLFASNIVDDPETSLLNMVLKFWPRTFTDLNCKDDLGRTVCVVNDLMRQAKLYKFDRSKFEADKVVEKVRDLNELCAAKEEWYRPLFPGIRFPPVAETMAEVDREKLKKFAAAIEDLLQPPNSLLEGAAESHD